MLGGQLEDDATKLFLRLTSVTKQQALKEKPLDRHGSCICTSDRLVALRPT